ncbi:hypothetical protein A2363_04175 [Candidatus Gottesmanbacteria bacterium RIFOXYB1_FULL_47_11]|uniref:Uncharacterized protein n=1 Tax=Candidatus Gottesmanbacteria bacterium RIFOXYB1_FULL_47_11 TaxID=1798401 RepID=A0A1F6BFG8_9BACT|nr:MAG: hypothetical protein A2363_04175 [Candidatus Gottesmanbacteria bacterium RIFOXYB1_FULL_47_11]
MSNHERPQELKSTRIDPYRYVRECAFRRSQSGGMHSFTGYDRTSTYREVWNVVPIDTPDRFMHGLENLMSHVQIESLIPDGFKKQKYKRKLNTVIRKYFDIHRRLRGTLTVEQQNSVQESIKEAKKYVPTWSGEKDSCNWREEPDQAQGSAWHNVYTQDANR